MGCIMKVEVMLRSEPREPRKQRDRVGVGVMRLRIGGEEGKQ